LKTLIFCLSLLIFLSAGESATAQAAKNMKKAAYDTGAEIFRKYELPGLTIAAAENGKIIWSESYGAADTEKNRRARIDTKYRVGSISKLLTAAALIRLSEKKMIDLDAPVQKYVPNFPPKNFPVTLRQLAGHTAGIRHYEYRDFAVFNGKSFRDTAEGLQIFQGDALKFEPGTDYFYSSYGYNLLGAAIEAAAKKPFAQVIDEEVTKPLKMKSTTGDTGGAETQDKAVFYKRGADKQFVKAAVIENQYRLPSGGYLSTAEDLLNFGYAFLQAGYLKKQTLSEMLTTQKLKNGKETGVGIGWRIKMKPAGGGRIFHHGGATEGGRAFLLIDEKSKIVVVLLANSMSDFGEIEAERIA